MKITKLYNFQFIIFSFSSIYFLSTLTITAQVLPAYSPIITEIEALESTKDAKCHATAARLEDFIYGTPLSVGARKQRIQFQQDLTYRIWRNYSDRLKAQNSGLSKLEIFKQVASNYFVYEQFDDGINVRLANDKQSFITARDFRQYGSVAYAYRAILAVQQSCILEIDDLVPLDKEVLELFKTNLDIAVLTLLNQADQYSRNENEYQISETQLLRAASQWNIEQKALVLNNNPDLTKNITPSGLISPIIAQKLSAYKAYNQINQAVFLRNIQVFLSKAPWPKDPEKSNELKNTLTELMVSFSAELLLQSQLNAIKNGKTNIQYQEVYNAVQFYLPHSINNFEDVTYFPKRDKSDRIIIESYDLDAFRDSGLHWQYLKFALEDRQQDIRLTPDPFALEIMVEGIAQFAVLIFRIAGTDAITNKHSELNISNIQKALETYQKALSGPTETPENRESTSSIKSAPEASETNKNALFIDETNQINLNFQHRNADWLSRLIRSYLVKKDENLARLGIPPAFGGSGVAAEDIDNDGWVDLLLLSGSGNALLKNNKGQHFTNVTSSAGLVWNREDGTFGEPRQPIIVDFDNDGLQDILITYANDTHRLYRNMGNGQFEDLTETAKLGGQQLIAGPATVFDYDKDGLLDIYIGYFGNYLAGELPSLKRNNTNGTPNQLFRNKGDFIFEEQAASAGVDNHGWTQAVGHSDINGDGWQDLIVGNDFGINAYYINNQDGTFTDFSRQMGADKPSYTMNVGIGDINADLLPDFYISNIVVMEKDDKYVTPNENTQAHFDPTSLATMRVVEANDLFLSSQQPSGLPLLKKSKNIGRGYSATGWSWDADFFDFDNDSDEDLYCLTGMNQYSIYGTESPYYNSSDGDDHTNVAFAASNAEPNLLFENEKGVLNVVEQGNGLDYSGTSRSAVYFDFDQDGDLDVVVNEYQGGARFFRNQADKLNNNWVSFQLQNPIGGKNVDAIGATLILTLPDGRQLWREVHSTTGYLSVHPKEIHFGLGKANQFELKIKWHDDKETIYSDLRINKRHYLTRK